MKPTRRRILALLAASGAHMSLRAQSKLFARKPKPRPAAPHPFVYIGPDTAKGVAKGIYLCRFDPTTGQLTAPTLAAPSLRPAYMALNHVGSRRVMYVCNEGDAQTSAISTLLIDPATGALTPLGQVSSGAAGPAYVAVDSSTRSAYVADYAGSAVASYRVLPNGTLSPPVDVIDFRGKAFGHRGPNSSRQDAPHPHSTQISPDNRFLIVNDLGSDNIVTFPLHPETAHLGPPTLTANRNPGAGPRHIAFHPNNRWVYGIDELSSKIDQYLWNTTHVSASIAAQAFLTDTSHTVSTLDPGYHGTNTAAEIAVSANGFYVYASNRGEDSLVVFAVDQTTGALSLKQRISCGGKSPRHFTLDPSGNWLLCGNQDSASVTVFARNAATGNLTGPVQTLPIDSPMFLLFA